MYVLMSIIHVHKYWMVLSLLYIHKSNTKYCIIQSCHAIYTYTCTFIQCYFYWYYLWWSRQGHFNPWWCIIIITRIYKDIIVSNNIIAFFHNYRKWHIRSLATWAYMFCRVNLYSLLLRVGSLFMCTFHPTATESTTVFVELNNVLCPLVPCGWE